MTTLAEATMHPERCLDAQLVELAAYAASEITKRIEALAYATAHRPSYAPKDRETASERGAAALLNDARNLLMRVQVEQDKRANSGTRTLISFVTPDGATVKTITRPYIFTEPQRASFLASAKAKGADVIGWRTVAR